MRICLRSTWSCVLVSTLLYLESESLLIRPPPPSLCMAAVPPPATAAATIGATHPASQSVDIGQYSIEQRIGIVVEVVPRSLGFLLHAPSFNYLKSDLGLQSQSLRGGRARDNKFTRGYCHKCLELITRIYLKTTERDHSSILVLLLEQET